MTVPTPYVSISPSLGPEGISRTVSGVGFTPGDWATFTYKTGLSRPKEELSAEGLLSPTGLQLVGRHPGRRRRWSRGSARGSGEERNFWEAGNFAFHVDVTGAVHR